MTSIKPMIQDSLLAGDDFADLVVKFEGYGEGTLKTYFYEVNSKFTPEQKEMAGKARAQRPSNPAIEKRPVSEKHKKIGTKLEEFISEKHMIRNLSIFHKTYGLGTPTRLSKMMNGMHNFTLQELQKMSEIIDVSLEELVS